MQFQRTAGFGEFSFEDTVRRRYREMRGRDRLGFGTVRDLLVLIVILAFAILALSLVLMALLAAVFISPLVITAAALSRWLNRNDRDRTPPQDTVIEVEYERY